MFIIYNSSNATNKTIHRKRIAYYNLHALSVVADNSSRIN